MGYKNKRTIVVLPAYNAEQTLEKTYNSIPFDYVDEVILVDDRSSDHTVDVANKIGIKNIVTHSKNAGYGANLKSCYKLAQHLNAEIIITLHPDYQYPPEFIKPMLELIGNSHFKVIFGSRILGKGALNRGMPLYKYFFNRVLTFIQNILLDQKLSEYHTGFRCFTIDVLNCIAYQNNSDDFVFDNEFAAQIIYSGYEIGEISCPARYFPEASSINFRRSIIYGVGVVWVSLKYFIAKKGLFKFDLFNRVKKNNSLFNRQN